MLADDVGYMKSDMHLGDITVSYWWGNISCDVCGEALTTYTKVEKENKDKPVRCCDTCAKSIIRRWSKE